MKVTFIGIGAIGLPMALQVKGAGHEVTGVDLASSARQLAQDSGLAAVDSFAAASDADVVVAMVATPQQLASLVDSLGTKLDGQTWVLMSTLGPDAVREQGQRLAAAGARVVDAPVTGGTARAKTGALVIFAAGADAEIRTVRPVLEAMGSVRVVGTALGDGQAIKVVNQHLCSVHIVAAAEALSLARSLGLDPAAVLELVEKGAAGSWMLSDRGPRMLQGTDVNVTSAINIFVKDSDLVAAAARACGADVPLLAIANARYHEAADAGLGLRDDSRVIETWD
ncbi:NAD(P)-dependent oxidoreductase [Chitinasiproducens palmae]|uniref:3-hydroxyisobutyrate dehydrogenase/putative dehydrogenase n=1 Tax=Chitinasiproducens palmae TaxID=1770053 RepID=A0A1H2PUV6_9BURK|nr:NAD(P)-dependent oxidoreductase [Chitinasiproducens palmae]SDV50637.1 3-hydroxyisobutyrate dehydrogenase/putative dehydrogenase [Chitinasiproducens palmae]